MNVEFKIFDLDGSFFVLVETWKPISKYIDVLCPKSAAAHLAVPSVIGAHVAVPKSQGLQKITTSPVSMENHIYGFGRRLDGHRKHTSFQITILTASIPSEPVNVFET